MKQFFLFALLFGCIHMYAQNWAPTGAKWHYTYVGFSTGYVEIANVGDTIINGQACQQLQKTFNGLGFGVTPESFVFDTSYTYENNGVVYVLDQNQWKILYNFNAAVGDYWPMAPYPDFGGCTANCQLKVSATGTKVINSETLNYLVLDFCNPDFTSQGFQDTIIEKIGFTGSYMFPYDMCAMAFDGNEGGPFRCYTDSVLGTYKPFYTNACDYIAGLDELNHDTYFELSPNPSDGVIQLSSALSGALTVLVYDQHGSMILSKIFDESTAAKTLELSQQAPGIYFIHLSQDKHSAVKRLVLN
jgi:hypothetical protein